MSVVRIVHNRENPYVQLNKKTLWDTRLSLQAVGLWARCMSRPEDWIFRTAELAKACGLNIETLRRYLNELTETNYVIAIQKKVHGSSRFCGYDYIFFEFPVTEEEKAQYIEDLKKSLPNTEKPSTETNFELNKSLPYTGFPCTDSPTTVKQHLLKKDLKKERKEKEIYNLSPKSKDAPAEPSPSADAEILCDHFLSKIKERSPNFREPNMKIWVSVMDKLIRLDKRGFNEIKELIDWVSQDPFWSTNCLSPSKLREKFDQLILKMNSNQDKARAQRNRTYALQLKEKYPVQMKSFSFDDKFAINRSLGKEIPFNLPEETFKETLVTMFGGTYVRSRNSVESEDTE